MVRAKELLLASPLGSIKSLAPYASTCLSVSTTHLLLDQNNPPYVNQHHKSKHGYGQAIFFAWLLVTDTPIFYSSLKFFFQSFHKNDLFSKFYNEHKVWAIRVNPTYWFQGISAGYEELRKSCKRLNQKTPLLERGYSHMPNKAIARWPALLSGMRSLWMVGGVTVFGNWISCQSTSAVMTL